MPIKESVRAFAESVRADRSANPDTAGGGTALELLIAPRFRDLVAEILAELSPAPPAVLPEFRRPGIGRPDLAFARPGSHARAFIELKAPRKSLEPREFKGHDADQFRRFGELPLWALTNFCSIKLFERSKLVNLAEILPAAALDPETSAPTASSLIDAVDHRGFQTILDTLLQAQPQEPRDAAEIADVLGHAARLVREIVTDQCMQGLPEVVSDVRADFNETLFSKAEAGGYDPTDADRLFSSAFAQTLVFGLLLAREAHGGDIDASAYEHLPNATYPLLRGTLRALSLPEVRSVLGVAFDVTLDAINSIDSELLVAREGRDPLLYLYEDFLRVFDPEAVSKYGVYYTPPEVVNLIVSETDRALRVGLGVDGLIDPAVNLIDPACGTGTFLISAANSVAALATERYGTAGAEVTDFARRMHGFELLVGPYTVAHYRMLRQVVRHGGTAERLPIFLTDTLAPPAGAAGLTANLAFLSAPMVAEREAADEVKRNSPILAILGNPPYKRLRTGEVAELVGPDMAARWEDLKQPVRDAGFGRALNAFPDLYIAFYRWALWRLFETDRSTGRGVLAFITNRGFLTGRGFGGLRQMLRQRFNHIRIIDLRGDNRGAKPANVTADQNVFNIEVGVCIFVAYSDGNKPTDVEGTVEYADAWEAGAFTRQEKMELARDVATGKRTLSFATVRGAGMDPLKPAGFADTDWPALNELFTFTSNGVVTYRDDFVYSVEREKLRTRITAWLLSPIERARVEFKDSAMNKTGPAHRAVFDDAKVRPISYRPLDQRFLYYDARYVDRTRPELAAAWGAQNIALFALGGGTGAGPAVMSHSILPDQHAFRGSYGGWVFPLFSHEGGGHGHYLTPTIMGGLSAAYAFSVTPVQVFDAVLCLLSATSYSFRFAHDLEDGFPYVPFPADPSTFVRAAEIGSRIRALQGFAAAPAQEFSVARLTGTASGPELDVPTPQRAFTPDGIRGEVALLPDRSFRIVGVPQRVWDFSVSGYQVLYRWLRARNGEPLSAPMQRSILDLVWRIEESLQLFDAADSVLEEALKAPVGRAQLGLAPRGNLPPELVDDSNVTA